jgi:rhamnosyltransferase subunit B
MASLNVILASIGTDGDVFPYLGLGAALRSRGHRVTLVASEDYRKKAQEAGISFAALASESENAELLGNPDFWHPLKGPMVGAKWGSALLPRHYELLADLAGGSDSVLVASPGLPAARLVQEKFSRPLATLVLQPWMIPSKSAPPVMPAGLTLPRWAPWPLKDLYYLAIDGVGAMLLGKSLNVLREQLGLSPVRRVFRWWLSPQLVIGMFPDWFGRPQPDWPAQTRLVGFPLHCGSSAPEPLHADLLKFCDAGDAPIAFTFGTGMRHAGRLFQASLAACMRLGVRGIFLTRYPAQFPAPLPPSILHVPFAPFHQLFPLCAAVVHHGGIRTLACALAAGVPQLVLPIAYDQTDNAIRVKRLGGGQWIKASRVSEKRISRGLAILLTPEARQRARTIVTRFVPGNSLEMAAHYVEQLGGRHFSEAK